MELVENKGDVNLEKVKLKVQATQAAFLSATAVKANQSYKVVSTDGTATLPCHIEASNPFPEVVRVSVLRGLQKLQKICTAVLNLTESNESSVTKPEGGNVSCLSNVSTSCSCGCRTLLQLCIHIFGKQLGSASDSQYSNLKT